MLQNSSSILTQYIKFIVKVKKMSVNKAYDSHYKDRQHHPYQQLLKNVLTRLDVIQNRQIKPFTATISNHDKLSVQEIDKIKVNMKIVLNSSIENLKRLEDSTRENWGEMIEKLKTLEAKMLRILREKQEALQFLELRIVSIESSQKNVTEFMRKLAEQENMKYSGVPLLQDRMKQIEHIFQLKDKKQSESLKIVQQTTKFETQKKFRQLEGKINQKIQSQVKQQHCETNTEQKLQQISDKLKFFDLQNKQQKRKISKIQQNLKQAEEGISLLSKKTQMIQKQLKNFERSEVASSVEAKNGGFKTENAQRSQKKLDTGGYHTAAKKTQPNYLKPEPPSINRNSQMESRKNQDSLLRNNQKLDTYDAFDKGKKNIYKQQAQQDPFENMGAGIRGLLKKSKQKDEKKPLPNKQFQSNRKPLPRQTRLGQLSRQPSPPGLRNRNLPPVKPDQKLHNKFSNKNSQITSEQEQQVYQVDQQGFLIDEEGNYVYDDEGNRIQLSQQDMNNLIQEN